MKDEILIILAEVSLHDKDIETAQKELLDLFLVSKRGDLDTSIEALVVKNVKCDCSLLVACEKCGDAKGLDGDFWKKKDVC